MHIIDVVLFIMVNCNVNANHRVSHVNDNHVTANRQIDLIEKRVHTDPQSIDATAGHAIGAWDHFVRFCAHLASIWKYRSVADGTVLDAEDMIRLAGEIVERHIFRPANTLVCCGAFIYAAGR
jgi:hypothetical protein